MTIESQPDAPREPQITVNVGRRVFLGIVALGALGVAFGNSVQISLVTRSVRVSGDCCRAAIAFAFTRSPAIIRRSPGISIA